MTVRLISLILAAQLASSIRLGAAPAGYLSPDAQIDDLCDYVLSL